MGKIQLLSEQIANLIAAGEVVERPASVVKELVENAIDAGSLRIDIEVEEGGLQFIRVLDNGSGIEGDDCELAFVRHATSKIKASKDLEAIRTLGFRGEALSSIASVARLTCISSTSDQGLGRKVRIDGGKLISIEEVSASRGTDVVVRDLFYQTPARLKYMKSLQTELNHISDYVNRLALARPDIAFSLKHNGNTILQTYGYGDRQQVVAAIYGTSIGKQMVPITAETLDYQLSGYLAKPEQTKANRQGMTFIVNGRYVRSIALQQAVLAGYYTLLPIHRYPIVVLDIQMDATLIDVNVHPAKLEVRFSKETELIQFIELAIRQIFNQQVLIPQVIKTQEVKETYIQEQLPLERGILSEDQKSIQLFQANHNTISDERSSKQTYSTNEQVKFRYSSTPSANSSSLSYRDQAHAPTTPINQEVQHLTDKWMKAFAVREQEEAPLLPKFPSLSIIGQMLGTYLIAQNEQGLFIIDQHAAHERIHYEYFSERFAQSELVSQELLVPVTLQFTHTEANVIRDRLILFKQVGVDLEAFGNQAFLVRACPDWFPEGDEQALVEEMCEWLLNEKKSISLMEFREKSTILCSCKASIKANQSISMLQMEALVDRLGQCKNPYTCPHGRPIVISFTKHELEKMFKRVM